MLQILRTKRHRSFYPAVGFAIASLIISLIFWPSLAIAVTANVFFLSFLIVSVLHLPAMTAAFLQDNAPAADEPAWVIFLIVLATVITAVTAMFILINQQHGANWLELTITIAAVPLGWATIHMIAAQHYAHIYWQPASTEIARHTSSKPGNDPSGGLAFPQTTQPCGADFVYFSYVIGMTAQTSDTNITTTAMRSVNLVHAILSFFFNTVLVAAAVNIVVALGT